MHLDCFRMRIARFVNRCIQLLRHRHLLIRPHFVNIVHGHHRPHFFDALWVQERRWFVAFSYTQDSEPTAVIQRNISGSRLGACVSVRTRLRLQNNQASIPAATDVPAA